MVNTGFSLQCRWISRIKLMLPCWIRETVESWGKGKIYEQYMTARHLNNKNCLRYLVATQPSFAIMIEKILRAGLKFTTVNVIFTYCSNLSFFLVNWSSQINVLPKPLVQISVVKTLQKVPVKLRERDIAFTTWVLGENLFTHQVNNNNIIIWCTASLGVLRAECFSINIQSLSTEW